MIGDCGKANHTCNEYIDRICQDAHCLRVQTEPLVNIEGLSKSPQINLSVRTLRTLWHDRKIPGIVLGRRTLLFSPSKVREAIEKFEVKAIGGAK